MKDILDILSDPSMDIAEFFNQYNKRKQKKDLYSKNDFIPQNLIKIYYLDSNHLQFKTIIDEFKKKIIHNENAIENVHDKNEREGLGVVYDKIENGCFSRVKHICVLLLIHQYLYSKIDNKVYGGKFRNYNAYITGSNVETTDFTRIVKEINDLNDEYLNILKLATIVNETRSPNLLIDYINKCIALKCKIIKIHPFSDGNGRSCRSLVSLLFKEVNLPPIYISKSEREEYIKAMHESISNNDNSSINKFYYYKICDSIYELDISKRDSKGNNKVAK